MEPEIDKLKTPLSEIQFHYIKNSGFRVLHCDGVIGAPTPSGHIAASFFNTRLPIPQQTVHKIDASGDVGEEIRDRRVQREGIIREVDVELVMNVDTAEKIGNWLLGVAQKYRRMAEDSKSEAKNADTPKGGA